MAFRQGQFGDVKVPLSWTAAAALIVAGLIAVGVLVFMHKPGDRSGPVEQAVDRIAVPVNGAVAAPVHWTGSAVDYVRGYFFAVSENRRLRKEVVEGRQWEMLARSERDVNDRLRAVLGVKTDPPVPMATALLVANSRGPFANTRLANSGAERGVKIGNPVMSPRGLVGRVVGVADGASRVLLLTDPISKVPVMIDRTNARAILTGDGGPNPVLDYLRGADPVKKGDKVVTSGDGGLAPRGLPVGVAVKGLDGKWRVRLDTDAEAIDYVRILQFTDINQVVDQQALAKIEVPPIAGQTPSTASPPAAAPVTGAARAGGGR